MQSLKMKALGHTRPVASRARPFTRARNARPVAPARAAAPEVEEVDALEPIIFEEEIANERIALTDETRLAAQIANEVMESYAQEIILEASLADDETVENKAASILNDGLDASSARLSDALGAAALTAAASAKAVDIDAMEEFQGATGVGKYDEEDGLVISEETAATVAKLKLTRQELANLVPKDWANVNVDWFTSKKEDNIPLPEYKLTFLWQQENIAVAVDQVYSRGQTSPLTEYFIWPRKDAWDELKKALEARPWVSERDKVILLNRLTDIINFWMSSETASGRASVEQARASFPDCTFA